MLSPFGEGNFKDCDSEKPYVYWVMGILSPYGFTDTGMTEITLFLEYLKVQMEEWF